MYAYASWLAGGCWLADACLLQPHFGQLARSVALARPAMRGADSESVGEESDNSEGEPMTAPAPATEASAADDSGVSSDEDDFVYFSHSEDEADFLPQETEARPEENRACIFEDRLERYAKLLPS